MMNFKENVARDVHLTEHQYAIIFTTTPDAPNKFAVQLERPNSPLPGIETAMLIVWALNRNSIDLKRALRNIARKFMRFNQKMQRLRAEAQRKAMEEKEKLPKEKVN